MLIAGCGNAGNAPRATVVPRSSPAVVPTISVRTLGGREPVAIAAASKGGAWLLEASDSSLDVQHIFADGSLDSSLSTQIVATTNGEFGTLVAAADDGAGSLLVASDMALYRVDERTMKVVAYSIPAQPADPEADLNLAPTAKGTEYVRTLAVDQMSGTAYLGLAQSRNLLTFSVAKATFDAVALPNDQNDVEDLAVLSDGRVAVSLHNYSRQAVDTVAFLDSTGNWTEAAVPTALFVVEGHDALLVGALSVWRLDNAGHVTSKEIGSLGLVIPPHPVMTLAGLVGGTKSGIVALSSSDSVTTQDLAPEPCSGNARSYVPIFGSDTTSSSRPPTNLSCQPGVRALASDGAHAVYAVTTSGEVATFNVG